MQRPGDLRLHEGRIRVVAQLDVWIDEVLHSPRLEVPPCLEQQTGEHPERTVREYLLIGRAYGKNFFGSILIIAEDEDEILPEIFTYLVNDFIREFLNGSARARRWERGWMGEQIALKRRL